MAVDPLIGVCVPTAREESVKEFVSAWAPHWADSTTEVGRVLLFVHEDRPTRSFRIEAPQDLRLEHTAQDDIGRVLGSREWIIPRGSGSCRSFPMYLAWKAGCEFIVTLDDDCLPDGDHGASFLASHLAGFSRDRWFRTMAGDEARGIPYTRLGKLDVRLNHGLWTDVPDLDAVTSLVRLREPRPVFLRFGHEVVPPGMAFPLCAMNVCYHRSLIPAAYNLLMSVEHEGLDRFDDIWSGLLLKRILDYKQWSATVGEPFVRHSKRSSPFTNLRKEALGVHLHEQLWDFLLDAPLEPGLSVTGAFRSLARRMRGFPSYAPAAPCPEDYFARLADAMEVWASLFESAES